MNEPAPYIVVASNSIEDLIVQVIGAVASGYKCQGGISSYHFFGGGQDQVEFIQAMVRSNVG